MRCFLPYDRQAGREFLQTLSQRLLTFAVGDGDGIVATLVLDVMRRKIAIARQDDVFGDVAAQGQDFAVDYAHDL